MGYPEAALSCQLSCLWTKAKVKCCTESLEHPPKPYPKLFGGQSRSPEMHRHLPVLQCQRHHLAALQTQQLFFPLALQDLDAFKMQNVLLASEKGRGKNT